MIDPAPTAWSSVTLERIRCRGSEAWIWPDHGSNCVGLTFGAPATDGASVLDAPSASAVRAYPTRYGCPILFPFPGHIRMSGYVWDGVEYRLPRNLPAGPHAAHGFAHASPWRTVSRTEDGLVTEFDTRRSLTPNERDGYPFEVVLQAHFLIEEDSFSIRLEARNVGPQPAPVALGLHPYFATGSLAARREEITVHLPGREERLLDDVFPDGRRRARGTGPLRMPPFGSSIAVVTTDIPDTAVSQIRGDRGAFDVETDHGFRDVAVYVPADQDSVSIEPLSHQHCAISTVETHAALALAPGDLRVATMTIRPSADQR